MWPDEPDCGSPTRPSIYNAIYAHPEGELRKDLIACLRQGCSTRKSRSAGADRRGQIPEMLSIHVRPEVNDRTMLGHWEGDLIKGGQQSACRRCAGGAQDSPGPLGKDAGLDGRIGAGASWTNSIRLPSRRGRH